MIKKHACDLPKASDVAPNKSDLTVPNQANATETDDDCVFVSPVKNENEPILIDSDDGARIAKASRSKKNKENRVERAKVLPVRRKMMCFCTSIYCRNCLNPIARKKLFQMYICHPVITTHIKMCETVALLINLPQDKVRRIFSRLQNYLILGKEDPAVLPCKSPLELCQVKRKLLNSRPVWFAKTFSTCCRIFRYKIEASRLVTLLAENGKVHFRRITNRISKKSKLIAVEDKKLRLDRISYIRRIQKYRKEGRRIIYFNATVLKDKMIVIAGANDGPITSTFITSTNAASFIKWVSKEIVEKLKDSSVFVLGPSCTFRNENCIPQQTDSKDTIISWLENEKIAHTNDMFKTELSFSNNRNGRPRESTFNATASRYSPHTGTKSRPRSI